VKLACSRCGQTSVDGHLWCQQVDCPAGDVPIILTYGEYLGDIKIMRLLRLFRTAAVYEAERGEQKLLLKVAHQGHEEILKKEAAELRRLSGYEIAGLPVWRSAYEPATDQDAPHGKAVFRGETHYYVVFEYVQGTFLRDMLLENPEPWYRDAAWITIALCGTVTNLHKTGGFLHGNINPDVILVTRDEKTRVPRPTLLDLGVLFASNEQMSGQRLAQIREHIEPAYIAPELLRDARAVTFSNATDVYGLGLVLYEMLKGEPAYAFVLRSDEEIYRDVKRSDHSHHQIQRRDVPNATKLNAAILRSVASDPRNRYTKVSELMQALVDIFGQVPPKPRQRNYWVYAGIVGTVAGIFMVVVAILDAIL